MTEPVDYAFLHGGGQGSWVWAETIEALARQTDGTYGRSMMLDIPGCGTKRGRNTDTLHPDDVARELIVELESAAMSNIVLVGHSQAGNVIPNMVPMRPALFRRIVYISCSIPLPGQTLIEMMGSGLHGSNPDEVGWPSDPKVGDIRERYPAMFCNDMSVAETITFMAKLGFDAWPKSMYSNTAFDFHEQSAVPATYVVCLRDAILPVNWQELFANRLHASRRIRIDAGHQVMNTHPEALAEILRHEAAPE
jgi:pimeloyl-ACP methyl ester carboxylesterase